VKFAIKYLLMSLLLFVGSCSTQQDQLPENSGSKIDSGKKAEVKLLDERQLQQLVTQRNGRILFLNVWATWCLPCREEFPDLVKLAESFAKEGVEFIGLSVDYPDEIDSKILPFLEQNPVNFPIYVQNFNDKEQVINFLNEKWSGALPATFVYSGEGRQLHFLLGQHSFEEFRQLLQPLFQ
jgi:thiol-disulfide isomerase/thioredoxin